MIAQQRLSDALRVGAVANAGKTRLELDLTQDPSFPADYRAGLLPIRFIRLLSEGRADAKQRREGHREYDRSQF